MTVRLLCGGDPCATEVGVVWVAGFHASLAGLLAVIGVYWLNLTFFNALAYLSAPAVAAVFFGHATLSRLHSMKDTKEKSD
jgi:hypothetical protein